MRVWVSWQAMAEGDPGKIHINAVDTDYEFRDGFPPCLITTSIHLAGAVRRSKLMGEQHHWLPVPPRLKL
jgi:hypothetical protein